MLGEDFPQSEIEAIIKEADLTKDGKISYAEFLALWEESHENLRESVIDEIQLLKATSSLSDPEDPMQINADADEIVARANFIERKQVAERRKSGSGSTDLHVFFPEGNVETIPDPIEEATNANGREAAMAADV